MSGRATEMTSGSLTRDIAIRSTTSALARAFFYARSIDVIDRS